MSPMVNTPPIAPATSGGRLITPDGRHLAFRGCSLEADARGGLAQIRLRQTFANDFDEPLQVTYQVPLPADAAIGGYSFELEGRRVIGEIETRESARRRFEEAILEGKTSALLEQDRTSLFTQEIGNVPPHTVITCELLLDQRLHWLEDGQWEWRFPTVIAPRYMGAYGRVPDQSRVSVDVQQGGHSARGTLRLIVRDDIKGVNPSSPTHQIRTEQGNGQSAVEFLEGAGTILDRDIAVRWSVASAKPGVALDLARTAQERPISESAFGLLTITPPLPESQPTSIARDLIILIDTSGSMSGAPLDLAKQVVLRMIDSLEPQDTLELIEFSLSPTRWRSSAQGATRDAKTAAAAWVISLEAGGGTEMESGLRAAISPLREDAQRQVILVTDGLVGFEQELVSTVKRLAPPSCRVHAVGIGPAANRSLTGAVARAGRGTEFLIDLGEDVGAAANRIVARVSKPLMSLVGIEGSALLECAAEGLPDLMAGCPSLIPVRLSPNGGELLVRGMTTDGPWLHRIDVAACAPATGGESIPRLFGRERAEELELSIPVGSPAEARIERVGLDYRIATRRTAWVAVSEEPTVDPQAPIRRVRIVQALPAGLSVEGLGLRHAAAPDELHLPGLCGVYRSAPSTAIEHHLQMPRRIESVDYPDEAAPCSIDAVERFIAHRSSVLQGVLISLDEGRAVIEFEPTVALDWRPKRVSIPHAAQAKIVLSATTKHGTYHPGQRIRLVIDNLPARITSKRLREIEVDMEVQHPTLSIRISPP